MTMLPPQGGGGGGSYDGGGEACLVAKQDVEFPQVPASMYNYTPRTSQRRALAFTSYMARMNILEDIS